MIGTKRLRKKGVWEIGVERGPDAEGKRRRVYATVRGTKTDAERELRHMADEAERVRAQEPAAIETRTSVADWVISWLDDLMANGNEITTHQRYESNAKRHVLPHLGALPIRDLSVRHVRNMERRMREGRPSVKPVGNRSIQVAHRILSGACELAVEMGHLETNVMSTISAPRCQYDEVIPPEKRVMKRLLKLARHEDHRMATFFRLMAFTGLRRGEGIALTWENVNLELGTVFVAVTVAKVKGGLIQKRPKTPRAVRTVDLDKKTVQALKEHRAQQIASGVSDGNSGLVFPNSSGEWMSPSTMDRDLKQIASRVGANGLTFHDFRHFHGTMLLQQGHNVVVVSQRLGHKDPSITLKIYGHVLSGWQKGAAETFADAMDDDEEE